MCVSVRVFSWGRLIVVNVERGRCFVLQNGWTALMFTAYWGHTATAGELVRLGADINAKDNVQMLSAARARAQADDAAWLASCI
jgi:hypothetical protein